MGRRGRSPSPRRSVAAWTCGKVVFRRDEDIIVVERLPRSLLDLRGTVPVWSPQDVAAVREQIVGARDLEVAKDVA